MLRLSRPLYPSHQTVAFLREQQGFKSWYLEENYQTRSTSCNLHQPLPGFRPDFNVISRQWLIQAPPAAGVSLQSGLLRFGRHCLYESNPTNLHCQRSFWRGQGTIPPGFWHRKRLLKRYRQPLVLLSTHNNPNYFHWLTQPGLAPLFLQEHFGLDALWGSAVALSHRPRHSLPCYVHPLLETFSPGTPVVHGIALASKSTCRFALQELVTDVVVSPGQLNWLKHCFHNITKNNTRPWRRVFISRQRSDRRRCLNEPHLFSVLAAHGFERHCLEDLSVIQQLNLFSESIVVVGAHGAGLSNLVACHPEASIVELIPRPGPFYHYYAMADILGLNHGHLLATRCDKSTDDFTIDPGDLIKLLRKMELL